MLERPAHAGLSGRANPVGTTQDRPVKAKSTQWDPGGTHLPENTGDKPFEVILVEMKGKAPAAK